MNFQAAAFIFFLLTPFSALAQQANFQFISPRPGSRFNRRETTISIRKGPAISWVDPFPPSDVQLNGSMSGLHAYSAVLSDDQKTLIIKPTKPFALGETVTVNLDDRLKTKDGASVGPLQFSFTVSEREIPFQHSMANEILGTTPESKLGKYEPVNETVENSDSSLPSTFPKITLIVNRVEPNWNFYLCNYTTNSYLMNLNTSGIPILYKAVPSWATDFKWEPNGRMTYYDSRFGGFLVLDSSYQEVDSILCGNGYTTDVHEIRMLPNGHVFLLGDDVQQVAMDSIVSGGNHNANVTGIIVQELDQNRNVVFQWRSWDHFAITDAIGINFLASSIDPVHSNAIEIDSDTSLILSSRHLSEITKIDRRSGEIIWRWGGKNNQFTFINDSIGFSYQHAVRKIANGHYTLFDNGNFHTPQFSRAMEYDLDEYAKTATLVWNYRHNPDISSYAMGYVQRLDDGSTLIGWGAANPSVTLVDENNSTLLEMSLPKGVFSYRAYAYPSETQNTTAAKTTGSSLPQRTSLSQNYPNPFNPTTQITYQLSESGPVKLTVYDLLGREVATLFDGDQTAGIHKLTFDASRLASGTYIYRLISGMNTLSKKMLILK